MSGRDEPAIFLRIRMPTLNWIGKEAVVKHHRDVPFRLLMILTGFDARDAACQPCAF